MFTSQVPLLKHLHLNSNRAFLTALMANSNIDLSVRAAAAASLLCRDGYLTTENFTCGKHNPPPEERVAKWTGQTTGSGQAVEE